MLRRRKGLPRMVNLIIICILLVLCAPGIWAMGSATSAMLAEKPDSIRSASLQLCARL